MPRRFGVPTGLDCEYLREVLFNQGVVTKLGEVSLTSPSFVLIDCLFIDSPGTPRNRILFLPIH